MESIKILFAASEASPFAKTGGLADVSCSLPKALKSLGTDIRVILPKYRRIIEKFPEGLTTITELNIEMRNTVYGCQVQSLEHDGILFYFVDNRYFFDRDGLYGHEDDADRFTFFCKAILEVLPFLGFHPDILHCNDWQTGVIPLLLKARYARDSHSYGELYRSTRTLYTIHNLKYQGIFHKDNLWNLLGLGWEYFRVDGIEYYDQLNYMKAGLIYADLLSTVSPAYAKEITTPAYGETLDGVLKNRERDLYGILNGIDLEENDPARDSRLFCPYDADHLEGKLENKKKLQETLGLPVREEVPVIGLVSRLVDQKGLDLIAEVLHELMQEDLQFIILGTGFPHYEELFRRASREYPAKVSANIGYDEILAQRIYAGSDLFLMPSLFEPCGLGQLMSLRYGTIPIVRETGGLSDTVQSYNEFSGEGNGFSFRDYHAPDMLYALRRALDYYRHRKDIWTMLVHRAMTGDMSWESSARRYMELYRKAIAGARE